MRESSRLEFKATYSNTFLKTVSAFANYGDGEILFGIADDGSLVGVESPDDVALQIENAINDALDPVPDYALEIEEIDNRPIVRLSVREGLDKPYFAQGRAYRRTNTSTVQVDRAQLKHLVVDGEGINFEELPSLHQDLTFTALNAQLKDKLGLEKVDVDTHRTLGLYTRENVFNNAASILADSNHMPGISFVRYGRDESELREHEIIENTSALSQLDQALVLFRRFYIVERIEGLWRKRVELIPESAFREAVANALVHRRWDLNAPIKIAMDSEKIVVTSVGGLPEGITEDQYFKGDLSLLRNPILGNIFFRLGLIERLGTGVRRIRNCYRGYIVGPSFELTESSISVTLPLIETIDEVGPDERAVIEALENCNSASRREIERNTGLNQSKVARILQDLNKRHIVHKSGSARSTRYAL